jgi:DNA-binding MarR family transcriptional regulator
MNKIEYTLKLYDKNFNVKFMSAKFTVKEYEVFGKPIQTLLMMIRLLHINNHETCYYTHHNDVIASELGVKTQTIRMIVDKLVKSGFIERVGRGRYEIVQNKIMILPNK